MALKYLPRPKKFLPQKKPKRGGGGSSSSREIDAYNQKIAEANKLIDQGKLSQANQVYNSAKNYTKNVAVEKRLQELKVAQDKAERLRIQREQAAARKRSQEEARRQRRIKEVKQQQTVRLTPGGLQSYSPQTAAKQIFQQRGKSERQKLNEFVTKFGFSTSLLPQKGTVEYDLYRLQKEITKTKMNKSKANNIIKKIKNEGKLVGLGVGFQFLKNIEAVVNSPKTVKQVAKVIKEDPSAIKKLPGAVAQQLKKGVRDFDYLVRTSPSEAIGRVGGEILFLKGTGEALKLLGRGSEVVSAKLNPKFTKVNNGKLIIKLNNGKNVNLGIVGAVTKNVSRSVDDIVKGTSKGAGTVTKGTSGVIKRVGKGGSKGGKTVNVPDKVILDVVKSIPKETVKKQTRRAGSRVTAISSQRDALFNFLRQRRIVRKPIPGEGNFPKILKRQLEKFDQGKLSAKQIIKLDRDIKKVEVKLGSKKVKPKGLLERSFFADPSGKIRPSRLGITKEESASISDIIRGNIRFKKNKPEILLFDNIKVQNFPKSLSSVKKKLSQGKPLTQKEADELLKFQLKQSGKFKPIGFLTQESEVTLAPGEIIRKSKTVATTLINGRKVKIVRAEVFKPKGRTKNLVDKFKKGKLTKKEERILDRRLKKETGIDYGVSSSKVLSKKYVPIKRISTSFGVSSITTKGKKATRSLSLSSSPKKRTLSKTGRSKPTSGTTLRKTSSGVSRSTSRTSGRGTSRTGRSTSRSPRSGSPTGKSGRGGSGSSRTGSPVRRGTPVKVTKSPPIKAPRLRSKNIVKVGSSSRTVKLKRGSKQGYLLYERRGRGGKFFKLKGKALSKSDAKDRMAHRLDNKISRTVRLVPIKVKSLGKIPKKQKGYFSKYKKNLRNYKTVKGKRVKTPLQFIEKKGRGVINTWGEKKQLALNRRKKSRPVKRPKKFGFSKNPKRVR